MNHLSPHPGSWGLRLWGSHTHLSHQAAHAAPFPLVTNSCDIGCKSKQMISLWVSFLCPLTLPPAYEQFSDQTQCQGLQQGMRQLPASKSSDFSHFSCIQLAPICVATLVSCHMDLDSWQMDWLETTLFMVRRITRPKQGRCEKWIWLGKEKGVFLRLGTAVLPKWKHQHRCKKSSSFQIKRPKDGLQG